MATTTKVTPQNKKSATIENCERAVKMRKDGEKISAIIKRTGMNYSQVWGAIDYDEQSKAKTILPEAQRTATKIAQMRDADKLSWGVIMVRCGWHPVGSKSSSFTLGKVTKLYKEATGISHEGSRIGHGGAFLLGDIGKALYRGGDRQRTGMQIPAGTSRAQIMQAIGEGLDEKLTKLVISGRISKATAATRKAAGMSKAEKALDAASPVKTPAKKAPAKATAKKAGSKPSKKAVRQMQRTPQKKVAAPTLAS